MKTLLATLLFAYMSVITAAFTLHWVEMTWLTVAPAEAATLQATSEEVRPKIRVGLYETSDAVTVTVDGKASIRKASGEKLHVLTTGSVATLSYDAGTQLYTASTDGWSITSSEAVKVQPNKKHKVSTITSYSNVPTWNTALNDNQFYGSVELNDGWVVNELGVENYVKGIAEASNDNEQAYLKALYTAARTYVYYHYLHPTKHAGEPYLVDATANDQVYRGYGFTQRSPNVVAAVEGTTGTVVTYEDDVVVTPYFSSSDGRTRAWSEVWAGDYAYLQSVDDPGCEGDTLSGHGVGMSAKGARYLAEHYYHWQEILDYYYQGVQLEQLW